MMVDTTDPIIREAGEGEQRRFAGGGVHRWLATSDETNGEFVLFEDHVDGGKATPLHSHPTVESFYVLEGEIVLHMDGSERRLPAGSFAIAPASVPHAFMVVSDAAKLLFLHTPGPAACQAFYWEASEPLIEGSVEAEPDFARVRAAAESTGGMTMLGPPPFAAPQR